VTTVAMEASLYPGVHGYILASKAPPTVHEYCTLWQLLRYTHASWYKVICLATAAHYKESTISTCTSSAVLVVAS